MSVRIVILLSSLFYVSKTRYSPTWPSLDSRKNPPWYDEAKFGIFMHWGVFSVPSFGGGNRASAWFWNYWHGGSPAFVEFMKKTHRPGFSYQNFARMFKAELFDPDEWADLLAKSGAKYYVITSKHHEGWTNWPSKVSWNWNSVDSGPHRDLIGDMAKAVRDRTNVTFALYFSLFEWFHPLYLKDKENNFKTTEYVDEVMLPQLYDIVNTYNPEYIFSDGDWEAPDTYFKSKEFLAWLFNDSPVKDTVVVNDRWCNTCRGKHGGVYTGDDRFHPTVLQDHKWENAMTVDKYSWGYRREAKIQDMLTMQELIYLLVSTVSCGGNVLMNIGPRADGTIDPFFQERLTQMGQWLAVNGEAIYASKPWKIQNDSLTPNVWYTSRDVYVYAIAFKWPDSGLLRLQAPRTSFDTTVLLLGYGKMAWSPRLENEGINIHVPTIPTDQLPCEWAWVFRLSYVG